MDFMTPSKRTPKKDLIEIYPKFRVGRSKDLMIRGGDFYAVWNEEESVWATDQDTVIRLIDKALDEYASKVDDGDSHVVIKHMRDSESGSIDRWRHFVQKQMEDNWVPLDGKLIFSNTEVKREDYSSHKLNYPLTEGDYSSFDELLSVLYSAEERLKIEWAIGAVVSGDSVKIQKFMVFVGDAGTGKSTVMKIIRMLFDGYTATIDAKAIGSPQSAFALESLKKNPLVAIQDDADLSSIKDNTRLNSLVSHEFMSVNEKFKSPYEHAYRCFIFLGSNDDVQITDSRSGIQRRLIDVRPTGKTFTIEKYNDLMDRIPFELNGIAYHCLRVYESNKHRFDRYKPTQSMRNTNPFYNFIEENYDLYEKGVSLKRAWDDYNRFCDENGLTYRLTKLNMKTEMSAYFKRFIPEGRLPDIGHVYNWYDGIRPEKFGKEIEVGAKEEDAFSWIHFDCTESILDKLYSDQPAQYAKEDGSPKNKWYKVKTTLKDIDTSKLHWFKLPPNIIKIDFDKRGPDGEKNLEENLKEANKFPKTYAEISQSGNGIHLYYIYDGDVEGLSRVYDDNIEVKFSYGDLSHRRILTKCNNIPLATINSGLPFKVYKPRIGDLKIENEKHLRSLILKALAKETHADTTSNVDWIYELLERAYISGMSYDVTDMADRIKEFAEHSTHQSKKCVEKFRRMKLKSSDRGDSLKGGMPVIDKDTAEFEGEVRNYIREKLINGRKNPEETIELISELLKRAYDSGLHYDVSDMRQNILTFVIDSGSKQYVEKLNDFKWKSDEPGTNDQNYDDRPIVFFDCEVFPNFNCICWKYAGENNPVMKMINPTPDQVRSLFQFKLVGFNNRGYDNHILYAIANGYTAYEVYVVSRGIINKEDNAKFREAYNLSYTDIYDFSFKKQSLKEWEIDLDINHQELEFPWDEPVDEKYWNLVTEYCYNDVIATEATFNHLKEDWMARQILADLADGSVNDSTNSLTTKLVFGDNKKPQLVYTDLATGVQTIGR